MRVATVAAIMLVAAAVVAAVVVAVSVVAAVAAFAAAVAAVAVAEAVAVAVAGLLLLLCGPGQGTRCACLRHARALLVFAVQRQHQGTRVSGM